MTCNTPTSPKTYKCDGCGDEYKCAKFLYFNEFCDDDEEPMLYCLSCHKEHHEGYYKKLTSDKKDLICHICAKKTNKLFRTIEYDSDCEIFGEDPIIRERCLKCFDENA
jgi:hypothetical protein